MQIQLQNFPEYVNEINVFKDGEKSVYTYGSGKFKKICISYGKMIEGAHQMPAFGVSLNRETVKAVKSGVWVEFKFSEKMEADGMPFEALLINVVPEYGGFNIIRYNTGHGYDGRCFYYDLVGNNMSAFYDSIVE